jgi:hypothetical protein
MKKMLFLLPLLFSFNLFASSDFCSHFLAGVADGSTFGSGSHFTGSEALSSLDGLLNKVGDSALLTSARQKLESHKKHQNLHTWTFEGETPINTLAELFEARVLELTAEREKATRHFKIAAKATGAAGIISGVLNLIFASPTTQPFFNGVHALIACGGFVSCTVTGVNWANAKEAQITANAFLYQLKANASEDLIVYSMTTPLRENIDHPVFGRLESLPFDPKYYLTRIGQVEIVVHRTSNSTPQLMVLASTYIQKEPKNTDRMMR